MMTDKNCWYYKNLSTGEISTNKEVKNSGNIENKDKSNSGIHFSIMKEISDTEVLSI